MGNERMSGAESMLVNFSGGKMILWAGQTFKMFDGDKWKIEGFKGVVLNTPIVMCSYRGGEPIDKDFVSDVKDGRIDFCGDSIALAISLEQKISRKPQG